MQTNLYSKNSHINQYEQENIAHLHPSPPLHDRMEQRFKAVLECWHEFKCKSKLCLFSGGIDEGDQSIIPKNKGKDSRKMELLNPRLR